MNPTALADLVAKYGAATDSQDHGKGVVEWFAQAVDRTRDRGGRAAIEIGVRAGGTSAMLCGVADQIAPDGFMVFSVDPWGGRPFFVGASEGPRYGEDLSTSAKARLAPFWRSAVFRMTSREFIYGVLPWYRWWVDGTEYPASRRFLSFVFLDGQHESAGVVQEAVGVLPFMAPGGAIVVDNTESCPSAIAMLHSSPLFSGSGTAHWEAPGGSHRRDALVVL